MIIDFHAHLLPGIDDGSRNIETSKKMLELCGKNDVDHMVATPHFYAQHDRIEKFLERREQAAGLLYSEMQGMTDIPTIQLGAETAFFKGISKAEQIGLLTIEGTNQMLLELPFFVWDVSVIAEVKELIENRGFHIITAHLERYFRIPGNKRWIKELLKLPVTVQINAESLLDWRERRNSLRLIRTFPEAVLGSDCHGMNRRPPNLWEGRAVIEKKLGSSILQKMDETAQKLTERQEGV